MSSEIIVMARGNFQDVEGLHRGIEAIRKEQWMATEALLMMASSLELSLSELPVYDTNGNLVTRGRSVFGNETPARKVAAYFRRAAIAPSVIASELLGAWSAFENKILRPAENAAGVSQRPGTIPGRPTFTGVPEPAHVRGRRAS